MPNHVCAENYDSEFITLESNGKHKQQKQVKFMGENRETFFFFCNKKSSEK